MIHRIHATAICHACRRPIVWAHLADSHAYCDTCCPACARIHAEAEKRRVVKPTAARAGTRIPRRAVDADIATKEHLRNTSKSE